MFDSIIFDTIISFVINKNYIKVYYDCGNFKHFYFKHYCMSQKSY